MISQEKITDLLTTLKLFSQLTDDEKVRAITFYLSNCAENMVQFTGGASESEGEKSAAEYEFGVDLDWIHSAKLPPEEGGNAV